MKRKIINALLAVSLSVCMAAGSIPAASLEAKAAGDIEEAVKTGLIIRESEINQLLTGDLALPTTVTGLTGASVEYSVKAEDEKYVTVEGNKLKITRPSAGEEDYKFTLKATVTAGGETKDKEFPLTIRAGLTDDSYAGYVYVCFANTGGADVQQVHFFLSEDGLNWTALNGCKPIFKTGTDYAKAIESYGSNSVNYKVAEGTDLTKTTEGDASVLFPFEGRDQGIRDPYLIRGCKADGSDSNKVWILATDLNTMSTQYGGNMTTNHVGNWGLMTSGNEGSRSLFVYETEDWVHWTRHYIDVATQADAYMAWAPEAIYNPVKDNYLVYWSARSKVDGGARDRLYCNETEDFVHFGPTKLYEQEPFFKNYPNGVSSADDGYGNIDTSQLWVAETKEDGTVDPYGTLYRLVKDETQNHIELMSADTVLDPKYEGKENQSVYDAADPKKITPYTFEGKKYATLSDLNTLTSDSRNIKRAEIVYNWFINESVGDHFIKISQKDMEKYSGAFEGATMFKFIDRDEWCVMIDNYGSSAVRYEPYTTTDLSKEDSIQKLTSGYGRTGGDVGCHGGMIPITVEEYNTLIDTYNADRTVSNWHKINYISVDTRKFEEKKEALKTAAQSDEYTSSMKAQMTKMANQAFVGNETTAEIDTLVKRADKILATKMPQVPEMTASAVNIQEESVTICTKATDGLKKTATLHAEADIDSETSKITFTSSKPGVVAVNKTTGVVTAKAQGSAVITATAPGGAKTTCTVTVKGIPNKITVNNKKDKQTVNLKVKKTFQIKVNIPNGTVCSKFNYKSDKSKIASVSKTGKITAKKKGTAKITVTAANNSKAKATITVKVK